MIFYDLNVLCPTLIDTSCVTNLTAVVTDSGFERICADLQFFASQFKAFRKDTGRPLGIISEQGSVALTNYVSLGRNMQKVQKDANDFARLTEKYFGFRSRVIRPSFEILNVFRATG
ncbi:MAG: hypothetical protein JWN64_709 [Parcubacteria group bacterium]|nr:hypothetical protein [Parcubacteria group bacterium]